MAFLIGSFLHYDRLEAVRRMHAGTEWQTALPRIEASTGFRMQLLPLICVFRVAPKYPLGDSQGHVSAWLPSPAPQRHLGKAGHVRRARQPRGRTAGQGQGPGVRCPTWHLVNFWQVLVPLRVAVSCHKKATLSSPPGMLSWVFTLLTCSFYLFYTIHISLEVKCV